MVPKQRLNISCSIRSYTNHITMSLAFRHRGFSSEPELGVSLVAKPLACALTHPNLIIIGYRCSHSPLLINWWCSNLRHAGHYIQDDRQAQRLGEAVEEAVQPPRRSGGGGGWGVLHSVGIWAALGLLLLCYLESSNFI
jgi:hypothetical protein